MSGASLCVGLSSERLSALPHLPFFFLVYLPDNEELLPRSGRPSPRGPVRRLLSYLLYAGVAAALGFVLWQQWQA